MTSAKEIFKQQMEADQNFQNQGPGKDYLHVQNDIQIFKEEPKSLVQLNIIPALVGSDKRIGRNVEKGVAVKGKTWYVMFYDFHRKGVAVENGIVCPKTFNQRCPVCELRAKKAQNGVPFEDYKHLNASRRCLYFVQILSTKDTKKTYDPKQLYVWDISQFAFQRILNEALIVDADNMFFPMTDENGLILQIKFSEESVMGNKFAKTSVINFKPRQKPLNPKLVKLAEKTKIDDFLVVMPYEEIVEMMEESVTDNSASLGETENLDEEDWDEDGIDGGLDDDDGGGLDDDDDEDWDDDEDESETSPTNLESLKKQVSACKKKTELKKLIQEHKSILGNYSGLIRPKDVLEYLTAKENGSDVCPFGHVFRKDCDKYEDCDNCEKWPECSDDIPF